MRIEMHDLNDKLLIDFLRPLLLLGAKNESRNRDSYVLNRVYEVQTRCGYFSSPIDVDYCCGYIRIITVLLKPFPASKNDSSIAITRQDEENLTQPKGSST